jgi:hypothetical protein
MVQMGSSGSGNLSDYSRKPNVKTGGGGSSGGSSGGDKCGEAFSVGLEDVGGYPYHANTGSVPPIGTILTIALQVRMVALDSRGTAVGALPTRYNYLAKCLEAGFNYSGVVTASAGGQNPQAQVDFAAI